MNYQTFSNLQFRPLLKIFFHRIHIDLRDPSGEKIPFVSVGITRLVLMFRKVSSIQFLHIRYYKMLASRQVEIPYFRAVGRQRGWRFGALAQVIRRTAIPFLRKYIVPVAKRVGADWNLLWQKSQRLLVVEAIPRQLQRIWERKL